MAKQLNVEMSFTADTSKAKQQIEQLQQVLQKLSSGSSIQNKGLAITKDIQEGMKAASQLQVILEKATNTNTGKLDLTKFTQSLNASKTNLNQLRINLEKLGPQGSQAFLQVARSISNANTPLLSVNKRLSTLFTTLKNTAKWQISSSLLHGFMGAVSTAYRYTQDLNESLNNIRIRTGQSTEEMAKFAEQANQAAKSLSTTTLDYTKAALIYYQQGLNDEQVKARTDVTVKMANVTRDSAETVSQQLTAVWNNFDKGGEKLEYIADVMNALGAATASSTSEIATGLQKFAAAADAAGLSYEYAASALATITATTRQSADTVGTGLRTVLARIESLNLGETLEDGVGLTKYTKALEAIGVQVLDNNGQLKAADEILDAMAEKWQGLTDAQKMATAETVGGIRQYTTIMALMENWDFMQKNVDIAKNSEGTLQEQADIYAESWEAAQKRVTAAAQKIYSDLIDDKFFITILNGAEKILTFIDDLIRSLGGLPGLLSTISAIVFKLFGPQIAAGLTTAVTALKSLTPSGQAQIQAQKELAWQEAQSAATNLSQNGQSNYAQQLSVSMQQEAVIQKTLIDNATKMSDLEQQSYQIQLDGLRVMEEKNIEQAKYLDGLEEELSLQSKKLIEGTSREDRQNIVNMSKQAGALGALTSSFDTAEFGEVGLNPMITSAEQLEQELQIVQNTFNKLKIDAPIKEDIQFIQEEIKNLTTKEFRIKLDDADFQQRVGKISSYITNTSDKINNKLQENIVNLIPDEGKNRSKLEALSNAAVKAGEGYVSLGRASATTKGAIDDLNNSINNSSGNIQDWAIKFVNTAQTISSLSMGINSMVGAINTLKQGIENGNLSFSQILSTVISLSMAFKMLTPTVVQGLTAFTKAQIANATAQFANETATKLNTNSYFNLAFAIDKSNQARIEEMLVTKGLVPAQHSSAVAQALLNAQKEKGTYLTREEIASIIAETLAEKEGTLSKGQHTIATIMQTVAQKLFNKELEVSTALMLGYAAIVLIVVAAIVAMVAIINKLTVTQQEAAESIKKSSEAYDEEKQKLDELKNSLQEVQDKIDELNNKDKLTLVEQDELKKLKHQEESLQRQIELQKKLAEVKRTALLAEIDRNYSKSAEINNSANVSKENYMRGYGASVEQAWNEVKDNKNDPRYEARAKAYQNHLNYLAQLDAQYLDNNKEIIEQAENNFYTYVEAIEDKIIDLEKNNNLDRLIEITRAYADTRKALLGESYNTSILEDAFGLEELKGFRLSDLLTEGAIEDSSELQKALLMLGIPVDDFISALQNKSDEFVAKFGKNSTEIQDWLNSLSGEDLSLALTLNIDGTETVEELQEKFEQLKKEIEATQDQLDRQTLQKSVEETNKISDKLEQGSTISADDMATLSEVYAGAEEYFQLMADGTYQLIGDASELKSVLEGANFSKFYDKIENLAPQAQMYTQASDSSSYTTINGLQNYMSALTDSGYMDEERAKLLSDYLDSAKSNATNLKEAISYVNNELRITGDHTEEFKIKGQELFNEVEELKKQVEASHFSKDVEDAGLSFEEVTSQAKRLEDQLEDVAEENFDLAKSSKDLAVANQKLNRGIKDLYDNFEDYQKILKNSNKGTEEYSKTMDSFKDSLADLFNIADGDMLSDSFAQGLLENVDQAALLQDAINGDIDAIQELSMLAANDIVMNIVANIEDPQIQAEVTNLWKECQDLLDTYGDLTTGMHIDGTDEFVTRLNEMIAAAGMTREQVTSLLGSMGMSATLHEDYKKQSTQVPEYTTEEYVYPTSGATIMEGAQPRQVQGYKKVSTTYVSGYKPVDQYVPVVSIETTSGDYGSGGGIDIIGHGSPNFSNTPAGRSGKGGGGGGGGGSTKTNYAKHQKSEPKTVERYKEINDELSDLERALDKASDASDRLWGQDRLKSMEDERDLIKQQADALQRKKKEAEAYYAQDKKALNDYLKSSWTGYRENENGPETTITSSLAALGLGNLAFEYDADGSITNWEDVYGAIYGKYNDMQAYWANPANWQGPNGGDAQEQYEKEILKPFEEWLKGLENADKQYQDTTELIKDLNEELADNLNTWQDLNFEELSYKLELKLQINENDLKRIEYYMDKLDGDFYQMGENLANYSAKIQNTEDALEAYKGHLVDITTAYTTLDEQYQAGQISEADYYKELQKIHDESYDYLSTLTELNKTMQEYFENTLDAAVEELEKYTDRLDHVNDSLEHYQEIMKLMGKQSDYKMIGAFLQGIANNNMNRYIVSKTFYEELVGKRGVLESQLASADLTEEGRKTIQKELLTLNEQIEEAEDKMLDNAQATAESMQAIWQNTVDEVSHEFEMLATDGLGFDFLNESLDRLESRQNEYLTKTNQLYEMNSLLRKLQADSDKTNNLAAKQRIANFSNEMEQLRDKNELSKLDLDIAKARYQQLLAEIALEEAQNAKSMVRLHRDNEGNYGYMYTADQDKIGAAEDALLKANNDLYNIVLEGTNKYGQMSLDLAEEYIEKRTALEQWAQENHLEESEEYQRKLYELQQEYERLRLASAREYNTAYTWLANPEVSTLGAEEAWTTEQRDAILASQDPYMYVETSKKLVDSTKDFFENIKPLLEGVNSLASAIGTPEELIGNLTDYSNELTEALIGDDGLVDAIGSELQEVLDGTNKYLQEQQKELLETQKSWEALDNEIAKAIVLQSGITGESIADETLQRIIASAKFDTGGYTGRWGNSGKLAILHEKELVLNQEDTENLLLSIDILRRLTNALDLQAMSSGLASISSATSVNAGGSTLQQDVTIHAEFPNAVDHNEIEMAFDTLINRASQYTGRF